MPKKVDIDGVETEVFTSQEIDEMKSGLEKSKQDELTKLQTDLKLKEDDLKKYQDKDLNFKNLREKSEKTEAELEQAKKTLADAVNTVKTEVLSGILKDEYNLIVGNLIGKDEELKKKFETEYNRLSDKPTTKETLNKKVMDAYRLATDVKMPTMHAGVISAAGSGPIRMNANAEVPPEEAAWIKEMAAKGNVHLKDDDIKKGWKPLGYNK